MPVVLGHQIQGLTQGAGGVPAQRLRSQGIGHGVADAGIVQGVQRVQQHAPHALHKMLHLHGLLQPVAKVLGHIEIRQLGHQFVALQEMITHKVAHAVGNARLVFGDDGRVGNWDAERVAKQHHHSKPIGHGAHSCCFGTCLEPRPTVRSPHELGQGQEDEGDK